MTDLQIRLAACVRDGYLLPSEAERFAALDAAPPAVHEHMWQYSIHDAARWCACGAMESTPDEHALDAAPPAVDEHGDPLPEDPHSADWYDGYEQAQRRPRRHPARRGRGAGL
jgi:hypothetical protein